MLKIFFLLGVLLLGSRSLVWSEEGEAINRRLPLSEDPGAPDISLEKTTPVYFDRHREGWFWRRELTKPPQKKKEKESSPKILPPTLKEIREQTEALLNRAIEAPTEENVLAYVAYQRLVMQRAEAFSRTWQRVLWQHPELDPTVENPVVTAGLSSASTEQAKRRDRALSQLAQESGLLYFFSGDCPLCEIQSPLLASFAETYGFSVAAISLDGAVDPLFPGAKVDRGAAGKLGVEKTPAIFLARPPSEVLRVGTGLLSIEDLAGRLYRLSEETKEKENENREEKEERVAERPGRPGSPDTPLASTGPRGPSAAAR